MSDVVSDRAAEAFPAGRRAALQRLAALNASAYGRTRNFMDGAVSRLSPYLRHGVLDLAEVRDAAIARSGAKAAYKFVFELAWRDYWRRVYAELGERIWDDLEPYATGHPADTYARELPDDIARGETSAACIDGFVRDLVDGGYVHNHARMYFAAYVVHFRSVRWQAGASFYLQHLLDGDPSSNNLSWQWVASTFSHEPYVFSRGNLSRYTENRFCDVCPLAESGCPFDATYPELERRLFVRGVAASRPPLRISGAPDDPAVTARSADVRTVVWHHVEALSPQSPARVLAGSAPAIVTLDPLGMAAREDWAAHRRRFVEGCASETEAEVSAEPAVAAVRAFAERHGARRVVVDASPDPLIRAQIAELRADHEVVVVPPRPFVRLDRATDLKRFSRYWRVAQRTAFGDDEDDAAVSPSLPNLDL